MTERKITVTANPSRAQSVSVTPNSVQTYINASPDTSLYYSTISKKWAIEMGGKVNGEDYSSKYYANTSGENAQIAQENARVCENTRVLLQGEYNEYSEGLNITFEGLESEANAIVSAGKTDIQNAATSAKNTAVSAIQFQQTTSVNAVKTEGTTQVNLAKAQATAAANSATQASNVVKEVQDDLDNKVDIDDMVEVNIPAPRALGEYVWSSIPLTDAALHSPDGTILDGNGINKNFVNAIADKYSKYPSLFVSEADWQARVEQFGACGKYVYNASANTVRLPKVTGFVEGTLDVNALGDLIEAGLPDHAHSYLQATFSQGHGGETPLVSSNNVSTITGYASASNPIYGKYDTVQPQSILGYIYIVVATTTKTDIEIDIDNVVTDLNNKVDISNMVEVPTIIEVSDPSLMPSWYRIWSADSTGKRWCVQGGKNLASGSAATEVSISLLKEFLTTDYHVFGSYHDSSTNMYGQCFNLTTSGFTLKTFGGRKCSWFACGYIK